MIPQSILDFFHAGKSLPFRSMTYFNFLLEATLAGSVLILVVLCCAGCFASASAVGWCTWPGRW